MFAVVAARSAATTRAAKTVTTWDLLSGLRQQSVIISTVLRDCAITTSELHLLADETCDETCKEGVGAEAFTVEGRFKSVRAATPRLSDSCQKLMGRGANRARAEERQCEPEDVFFCVAGSATPLDTLFKRRDVYGHRFFRDFL